MNERRQCSETYAGQRCPLPANHLEPHPFGNVRSRVPEWIARKNRGLLPAKELVTS